VQLIPLLHHQPLALLIAQIELFDCRGVGLVRMVI
jgi:hypothetical protein